MPPEPRPAGGRAMTADAAPRPVAVTCGDPAGIGPEVIARWLHDHPGDARDLVVIAPPGCVQNLDASVPVVPVGRDGYAARPGRPDGESALVAWAALERAAAGGRAGEYAAVVTGPVSKERLAAIGFPFPGQTEFFAARWGGDPVMAFCGGQLRVALATWHVPLRDVPGAVTPAALARAVRAAAELAAADGIREPRVAVCGLNPHAGEGGLLGTEERDVLEPALEALRGAMPGLSRCLPGDTVFGRMRRGEFDAVVALYHDQGLAPLKTLEFDTAVNVTLGLPFIRTSPDHGTAFALAGRNEASATSFGHALEVARRLIKFRARR